MKYHGIKYTKKDKSCGLLKCGFLRFLDVIYVDFYFKPVFQKKNLSIWDDKWIDKKFRSAVDKFKDTYFKFDAVAGYLSRSIKNALQSSNSNNQEQIIQYQKSLQEIPIFLDSLLSYFRIQADCIANTIPNLYGIKGKTSSIARDSFRKHKNWFTEKNPNFDKDYSNILSDYTAWFDKLAGNKKGQGLRDILTHYRGIYQISWLQLPNRKSEEFNTAIHNESGYVSNSLLPTLIQMVEEYFEYLDSVYVHFCSVLDQQIGTRYSQNLDRISQLLQFTGSYSSSWLYPELNLT